MPATTGSVPIKGPTQKKLAPPAVASVLAIVAGATMLSSSVPEIYANFLDPDRGLAQSLDRNLLQFFGNFCWFAYACLKSLREMQVMAGLGMTAALILIVQLLSVQTG